jgi:hypothetical protein
MSQTCALDSVQKGNLSVSLAEGEIEDIHWLAQAVRFGIGKPSTSHRRDKHIPLE